MILVGHYGIGKSFWYGRVIVVLLSYNGMGESVQH